MNGRMDETFGAYEIVDIGNAYFKQTNDWDEIEKNIPEGRYVLMESVFNRNQKKNPPQTEDNKSIGKSAIGKKMRKGEPIKTKNKTGKMGAFSMHLPVPRNVQFNLLMDELKQIFSQKCITDKTGNIKPQSLQKDYGEIYSVPNNRPADTDEIKDKKKFVFRSRSNACVSQSKKLYLKETKFTKT